MIRVDDCEHASFWPFVVCTDRHRVAPCHGCPHATADQPDPPPCDTSLESSLPSAPSPDSGATPTFDPPPF